MLDTRPYCWVIMDIPNPTKSQQEAMDCDLRKVTEGLSPFVDPEDISYQCTHPQAPSETFGLPVVCASFCASADLYCREQGRSSHLIIEGNNTDTSAQSSTSLTIINKLNSNKRLLIS